MNKEKNLFKKIIITLLIATTLLDHSPLFDQIDYSSIALYSLEESDFGNPPRY